MTHHGTFIETSFTHAGYRQLLGVALDSGYTFVDYTTAARTIAAGETKLQCLLRHDCDNDLVASRDLAVIEAELNIRSTYFLFLRSALYNPFSQPNRRLIEQMVCLGHWLGLHFDEKAYPDADAAQIAEAVDIEREWMRREFGNAVTVISFHQPSQRVLQGNLKLNCINTYDAHDMAGIFYISDSNKSWKGQDPLELFRNNTHDSIQLLVHPEWWSPEPITVAENWCVMFRHQFELAQHHALEWEHTYKQPYLLRLEPDWDDDRTK